MKAISLWEPWASAMALGIKRNETRSWPTSYRGDLVICAAKRKIDPLSWRLVELFGIPFETFKPAYGMAVCIVEVYACCRTDLLSELPQIEQSLGDYTAGRWAWRTRNLRKLATPIPVAGRQGLFEVELPANCITP